MRIKESSWLPFPGFQCITIFNTIYVRKRKDGRPARVLSPSTIRHEHIHYLQQKEMLYVLFFLWYGLEWVIRYITYSLRWVGRSIRGKKRKFNPYLAYKRLTFEQEAYQNENDAEYIDNRRRYSWIKYYI